MSPAKFQKLLAQLPMSEKKRAVVFVGLTKEQEQELGRKLWDLAFNGILPIKF